jgi:cellulose synthase/poly-beta-1,6-N-acetylglucosamine synthase-like glycosyltransferase
VSDGYRAYAPLLTASPTGAAGEANFAAWVPRTPLPPVLPRETGSLLVAGGHITQDQLDRALAASRTQGGYVGEHLVARGDIHALTLYRVLATLWQAPLVDLAHEDVDEEMLRGIGSRQILAQGWIPVRRDGDTLVVATTVEPTRALLDQVRTAMGVDRLDVRTITPRDYALAVGSVFRNALLHDVTDGLADAQPERSARVSLYRWQQVAPVALIVLCVVGMVVAPSPTVVALLIVANLALGASVSFKLFASLRYPWVVVRERWRDRRRRRLVALDADPVQPPVAIADRDLPVYTILVPAFHEANVISKVIDNLDQLDYPKSKLDVLVLLEEDDTETIAAARAARPPSYVRIVIVPRGVPQTKPRACNYGLSFARGSLVVIFDAEDRPEPDQLRRVVADFARDRADRAAGGTGAPLVCVQCALNYSNAGYNVLTRMFAIEYTQWFDMMLPGLDGTGIPIPLGGTSNHFDTEMLRLLGGWDPYNVTEDADLGMRASALGFRVGVNSSTTWEEACSQTGAWIKQRTRWIKGYMITAAVNFRHPVKFYRATGPLGLVGLTGLILGTPAAFVLYPLLLALTLVTFVLGRSVDLDIPPWLVDLGVANFIIGNGATIVVSALIATRRHGWRIGIYAVLNPLYWVLHSIAAWRAAWQTLFTPHHWEKTPHGLSEDGDDDD